MCFVCIVHKGAHCTLQSSYVSRRFISFRLICCIFLLLGIANALDLTDRILPRLQSRPKCKPKLLNFTPYSKDQLVAILKDRLSRVRRPGEYSKDLIMYSHIISFLTLRIIMYTTKCSFLIYIYVYICL